MRCRFHRFVMVAVVLLPPVALAAPGAEWFVTPDGTPDGRGTKNSPWDLKSTLEGRRQVFPGDTIWIAGGNAGHIPHRRRTTEPQDPRPR